MAKNGEGQGFIFHAIIPNDRQRGRNPPPYMSQQPLAPPAKNVNLSQVLPYKAKMFLLNYSNTACSSSTQLSFVVLNVKL